MDTTEEVSASKTSNEKPAPRQIFPAKDNGLISLVNQQTLTDTWNILLGFRFINALLVRTFFQPDEYFQSLEPAWQMVYGPQSGAWITWEWQYQLRSSVHPALFAVFYYLIDKCMEYLSLFPQFRAMVLASLPNAIQAVIAATGDYYTWQLAEKIHGNGSNIGWATLLMTMFSPWQWFCSTRTFSNCLETTLTIAALYSWPWGLTLDPVASKSSDLAATPETAPIKTEASALPSVFEAPKALKHLRISLILALTAIVLRPTNGLIWLCIVLPVAQGFFSSNGRFPKSDFSIFLREGLICGAVVLGVSSVSDYIYFGTWTFPPYQWLTFNLFQNLAVFYGRNYWHYYLSQGLPLLLTTYLPFAIIGMWKPSERTQIQSLLTVTVLTTLMVLSQISHKEVRFIYPLLPILHILAAPVISSFFYTTTTELKHSPPFPSEPTVNTVTILRRKGILGAILFVNVAIAYYTTRVHQAGVLAVMPYLRSEYEALALDNRGILLSSPHASAFETIKKDTDWSDAETFVGFLMPCHSTPWRSQLFYPGLKAWALTCEPPISLPAGSKEREEYRDEGDRFYDDPVGFLRREIGGKERPWPRYVVGFEGIEQDLKLYYAGEWSQGVVREKWRVKNSDWHDDSRRKGDVVVWEFVNGEKGEDYVEMRPNLMA